MRIILGIIGEKKRSARKNNQKILEHNRLKPKAGLETFDDWKPS